MRRKIFVIGLCVALSFSIAACGNPGNKKTEKNSTTISTEDKNKTSSQDKKTAIYDETTVDMEEEAYLEQIEVTDTTQRETNNQQGTSKTSQSGKSSSNSNNAGDSNTGSDNKANDNYKILSNYEVLGSRYDKYKNAYKSGSTSDLSGDELTFYKNLKECLDNAEGKSAKVEKEKAVHDWIVLNCEYDEDNYLNGTIPWDSYNPEGVFIKHRAVCNGYALAFQLCMDILGIDSKIVVGTASYNYHAWNIVKLDDGCWYHVDVTWDDPVSDRKGRANYTYFNVTDEYITEYGKHNFKINETCNSTKYGYWNYFENDTLYVETLDELYDGIIRWIKNGKYEGTIAMEYRSSDYDSFDNVYDFMRVYKDTRKEVVYRIDQIYEDNGTTHFPNGCAYAKFTASTGGEDDVIKFISSVEEYGEYIEKFSEADNASRTFHFFFDSSMVKNNDLSSSFVKTKAVKAVQFVQEEYLSGNDTYHIQMAFDYDDETLYTIDQLKAKFDELYNAGTSEYYINYYAGLSGDNDYTIIKKIGSYLSEKYNVTEYHGWNQPICWKVERNYEMDQTYKIMVLINGK